MRYVKSNQEELSGLEGREMGQKKSVLVMRDTGMNNNEILAEKLSTDWEVQILSVRDDPGFFHKMVKNKKQKRKKCQLKSLMKYY